MTTADPFGTAHLRRATLAAWVDNPARFREDANGEEDHARRHYRDRVVVELAQNAADAATRRGSPGTLTLDLQDGSGGALLVATSTGEPLDAAGVASLASLRASAKRARGTVGRFGVGFAATRAVSDRITASTALGGVEFSVDRTRAALEPLLTDHPALAREVHARGSSLPVLRLPFATEPDPAAVRDHEPVTVVVLHLRDQDAADAVRAQLDAVDDALLLALPALARVVIRTPHGSRTLADVEDRWVVARRDGPVPVAVLADRPVEDRNRDTWQVTWAAPRPGTHPSSTATPGVPAAGVVHAPTPTDEPSTAPGLLVATFPLDPGRRHVETGPLTDLVVEEAARTWAALVTR
ncbi:sacsin N-terminal ATP-binding-like domain-containing protein, partial [Cellulomonas bogoriensis]|uniref:sacsin N-terminal ATP-binding-like domain-containing protein n=1 Tax=Cellulomonas bogoriensis TaxID=301388 RepID=UPI0005537CBA